MQKVLASAVVATMVLAFVATARAQINGPTPTLMGQPSSHLYSVPGVINSFAVGTHFACTNTTSQNVRVGVEVFVGVGLSANDPSATSVDLLPSGTRLFATVASVEFPGAVDLALFFGGPITGSARILATNRGVICSAFLVDTLNSPPASMADLTVVKKTRQKGD